MYGELKKLMRFFLRINKPPAVDMLILSCSKLTASATWRIFNKNESKQFVVVL